MKYNWLVKDQTSGLYKYCYSISEAKLYYEKLKEQGLKPKIKQLNK